MAHGGTNTKAITENKGMANAHWTTRTTPDSQTLQREKTNKNLHRVCRHNNTTFSSCERGVMRAAIGATPTKTTPL